MSGTTFGRVSAVANFALQAILVKPKRSIGGFKAQVTISEQHSDDLELTEHPIEQGAAVTDHSFVKPADLVIVAGWSDSPSSSGLLGSVMGIVGGTIAGVQSLLSGNSQSQVKDMYAKLLALQRKREPFDVYTGKRVYKNMLIKSLTTTTAKETENAMIITFTLRQVLIVKTQTVNAGAPKEAQKNPAKTLSPSNLGSQALQAGKNYLPGGR